MGMPHVNYEPTEYEQMLIAAKWISIEDVDTLYQEYTRGNCDSVSYSTWLSMRREWDELNAQYEKELQPLYDAHQENVMSRALQDTETHLLRRMSDLEVMLGY